MIIYLALILSVNGADHVQLAMILCMDEAKVVEEKVVT